MSEKKIMTVAELAAYLRTIPNQNLPVRIEATGYLWHDHDRIIDLGGYVSSVDYGRACCIHAHDDYVAMYELDDDELLDDDYDGSFLDDDDIPALNAAAANAEADELVRRAQADAAFYGVS